jgi:hypothetical protein
MMDKVKSELDIWKLWLLAAIVVGCVLIAGISWYLHHMIPMWAAFFCIIIPVGIVQFFHWRDERDDF